MDIPVGPDVPYSVTRFASVGDEIPKYYQMFMMPFTSMAALQRALDSAQMQEVAGDAVRISSGGTPSILMGKDE